MKIRTLIRSGEQGTVLLICLMGAALMGLALASYLILSQQEYLSTIRSQTWNRTIPVTEAGTEDAMALLNKYAGTSADISTWTNSVLSDGWTALSSSVFYAKRYVNRDYYEVYITNSAGGLSVKSIGTLAWNYMYSSAPQTFFAAAGVSTAAAVPTNTARAVLLQVAPPKSYFLYGILAKKGITISGGGTNDSVNSLDPNYLANPWSRALEHANGSIGTIESNVVAAVGESSSTIYGHVNTGPGSTITVSGGSGGIGDISWLASHGGQIESGWANNTLNIAIPDAPTAPAVIPTAVGFPGAPLYILSGLPGATKWYYTAPGANYGGGSTILVTNGSVGLICRGDFTLSGGSSIVIGEGATLTAYFNGKTTLSGGGVINGTQYATNCMFYGSTNCTSITYSGSSDFIGVVDAPEAVYTQSGGSGVIGALIVYSFTQSGGKSLMRYDEALGSPGGPGAVYRVVSWQEVPP